MTWSSASLWGRKVAISDKQTVLFTDAVIYEAHRVTTPLPPPFSTSPTPNEKGFRFNSVPTASRSPSGKLHFGVFFFYDCCLMHRRFSCCPLAACHLANHTNQFLQDVRPLTLSDLPPLPYNSFIASTQPHAPLLRHSRQTCTSP